MRTICYWLGTDSYLLRHIPPGKLIWQIRIILFRIKWKILHRFFNKHWIVNERMARYLIKFGVNPNKIEVVPDRVMYPHKIQKQSHSGFEVLYYFPYKHTQVAGLRFIIWLYGADIIEELIQRFKTHTQIRFRVANGEMDMNKVYPTVDLYIRPTRHDGEPRMIMECKNNEIDYIFSRNGNPDVDEFESLINLIYDNKRV